MIYEEKPKNFNDSMQVCAVYGWYEDKILLLKRSSDKKIAPGKWSVVAGKVDVNENLQNAALREFYEETNLNLIKDNLEYLKPIYVKWPGFDFVFHLFKYEFDSLPEDIKLNSENQDYKWVDFDSVDDYDLIDDEKDCMNIVFGK